MRRLKYAAVKSRLLYETFCSDPLVDWIVALIRGDASSPSATPLTANPLIASPTGRLANICASFTESAVNE